MARERLKANDRAEASLFDRRSYLKLAGSAAAVAVAGSGGVGAATSEGGYGTSGYGEIPYGSSDSPNPAPVIERFEISKSEQLGATRMFSVKWSVTDDGGDLDTVEVVVVEGPSEVAFTVEDVDGASDSGWKLFQFPTDTSLDVNLRVTDAAGSVTSESRTITL